MASRSTAQSQPPSPHHLFYALEELIPELSQTIYLKSALYIFFHPTPYLTFLISPTTLPYSCPGLTFFCRYFLNRHFVPIPVIIFQPLSTASRYSPTPKNLSIIFTAPGLSSRFYNWIIITSAGSSTPYSIYASRTPLSQNVQTHSSHHIHSYSSLRVPHFGFQAIHC